MSEKALLRFVGLGKGLLGFGWKREGDLLDLDDLSIQILGVSTSSLYKPTSMHKLNEIVG